MNLLLLFSLTLGFKAEALANTQLEVQILTPTQVYSEIQKRNVAVFDVNPEAIYKKGHVPKSKNISFSSIENHLPKSKSARLIFYCMNEMCSASHQAAETAIKAGYKNVARMPAGIAGWLKQKLPTETIQ